MALKRLFFSKKKQTQMLRANEGPGSTPPLVERLVAPYSLFVDWKLTVLSFFYGLFVL